MPDRAVRTKGSRKPQPVAASPTSGWMWLAAALAGVFLIKLVVVLQLKDHPLLQADAGLDTTAYVNLAREVLAGNVGLGPGLYYVSPFYIYFLALIQGLTGSFTAVRVVQAALGTLTVALIFIMAREWFGRRAAWIAAGAAALCGVLTFYEVLLLQSGVDGVLTAAGLCALTLALRGSSPGSVSSVMRGTAGYIAAGAIFGLQTLNRPNVLLPALVFVVLLVVCRRAKASVCLAVGLVLGLAPVGLRNVIVSHQWSLVSSHGGLNFYIGNHEGATGLYEFVPGVRPGIEGQRDDTRHVAEAAVGHALTDAEVSDYFFRLGETWMLAHPVSATGLLLRKFFYVFHADHLPLPHSYDFFADDARTALRWLLVNPWLLVPIGLAGFLLALPRDDRASFLIWASFAPAYAAAVAVFFVAERYRVPLFVPLAVGAGAFVDRAIDAVRTQDAPARRWLAGAASATAILVALVNWPVKLSDSREGDRVRMVTHAAEAGRFDEAEHWGSLAEQASTAPQGVDAAVGHAFVAANQPARALGYLQRGQARGSRDPLLLVDLASAYKSTGDAASALAVLRSLEFPPGTEVHLQLEAGRLAATLGDTVLAEQLFRAAVKARPDLAEAWAQLGFDLLVRNEVADAAPALAEAVRLNPRDAVALGGLAVCESRLGRPDEALTHARAALAIDPHEALAGQVVAALGRGK